MAQCCASSISMTQCCVSGINMAQCCASGVNVGVHHASIWLNAVHPWLNDVHQASVWLTAVRHHNTAQTSSSQVIKGFHRNQIHVEMAVANNVRK